jgi:hypothetical protein
LTDALGLPITHIGSTANKLVNNGFEGSIIEAPTAFKVIDEITISGTTTGVDKSVPYLSITNTKGEWSDQDGDALVTILWNNSNWLVVNDDTGEIWTHPTGTGTLPPAGQWPDIGDMLSPAPFLAYDSYMVENEELKSRTITEDLARENTTQRVVDQWKKPNGVCVLNDRLVYSQSVEMTGEWIQDAEKWANRYTDECGTRISALRDANGVLILDGNGDLQAP